jgi:hypothetical protein
MSGLEIIAGNEPATEQHIFARLNALLIPAIKAQFPEREGIPTAEEYGLLLNLIRGHVALQSRMTEYYEKHHDPEQPVVDEATKARMEKMADMKLAQDIKAFLNDLIEQAVAQAEGAAHDDVTGDTLE